MSVEQKEAPPPAPLETLGDVRRALANALRRIERGTMDASTGGTLINGYGVLAKLFIDRRDSRRAQHLDVLWREREAAKEKAAEH